MAPFMIGITGPSCSGKSRLAEGITHALRDRRAVILPLDAYYHDLGHLPEDEISRHNFDSPDSLDTDLLIEHVKRLAAGETVRRPIYTYATHRRSEETELLKPGDIVIVEGLFSLYWSEIRELYDLKIFVDLDDRTSLKRRKDRDFQERGASQEFTTWQYRHHVRPMYECYILPSCAQADLVLNGADPPDTLVRAALEHIPEKKH